MLKSLYIKDYALIDEINIDFKPGLNIITGETGAGKSILIDALNLLLGVRASSELVRKGAVKALVEGIFDVSANKKVKKAVEDADLDLTDELILRREISSKSNNRCFINDTPVTLQTLKEFGNLLVDLHGQHEHQSLLRTETHIDFIDEYAGCENELQKYQSLLIELKNLHLKLIELAEKESELKEKREFYKFQIREIDAVNPQENEDAEIEQELKILENYEKLLLTASQAANLLYEDENSIQDKLQYVIKSLKDAAKIDNKFIELINELETALLNISDAGRTLSNYGSSIELDPQKLELSRQRLIELNRIKKKYGGTINSVIEHRKKIGELFELSDDVDVHKENLIASINNLKLDVAAAAKILSTKRKKVFNDIKKGVEETLKQLGIQYAKFEIKNIHNETNQTLGLPIEGKYLEYNEKGIDNIEFFISANKGEDLKPLAKTASGGEISRIMLSLKTILAKNDKLPLLIFDEIDTGVSGQIAQKVGKALKELAAFHQIIAITHLPQIAGLADFHFLVEKVYSNNRTSTSIKLLNSEEQIREVAKLMSGEVITDASIKGAKELMGI